MSKESARERLNHGYAYEFATGAELAAYEILHVQTSEDLFMIRAGKDFIKSVPVEVELTADRVWKK